MPSWRRSSSRSSRRSPARGPVSGCGYHKASFRGTVGRSGCGAGWDAGRRSSSRCRSRGRTMREPPKILVVDDEESVVVTIKAILQLDGYDVTTATTFGDAERLVRERTFDLVLTDLRLDDGDGIEILRTIQQRSPDTVTIMLTGYASLESAIQSLRAGAYDYLVKPSEVEELRNTVTRGVERRRLGLELRARIAELAELNASLQQRIDEATAELRQRYEELKELDRMKSQFLSIASHELKTPITAMSGFLQVALRRGRRIVSGGPEAAGIETLGPVLAQLDTVYPQTGQQARPIHEPLDGSPTQTGRAEFNPS